MLRGRPRPSLSSGGPLVSQFQVRRLAESNPGARVLLVGPHDPHGGEYTFLAPPLGVWRLAGVLSNAGVIADVFDPNCCEGPAPVALEAKLRERDWNIVGFSTTGMTLRFDLALAHLTRRVLPAALLLAGGMEATFDPDSMFRLGPFDRVVLGEGEKPLLEIVSRVQSGRPLNGIAGTAWADEPGRVKRIPQTALSRDELRDAIFQTPYERMPYRSYWDRLERAYRVRDLPVKADREARLAELRSVRLITLNYCPMGCTFCSSTNFLNAAQDSTALLARLDHLECVAMMERIVRAFPEVRTIIFQDDIFVFPTDHRIMPLCAAIEEAKSEGRLPGELQFISTNRIDSMTPERLRAMARAGFRVLGFGVENFSRAVLAEFNKARIHPRISAVLSEALKAGITPFMDMILTSPRCRLDDLAETVREGYKWTMAGCEAGMYPYVIPFSGAPMSSDPSLRAHTVFARHQVAGTDIEWDQPSKILPIDPEVRRAILEIEADFNEKLTALETVVAHLPSRVRSLLMVYCAIPVVRSAGFEVPGEEEVLAALCDRLPGLSLRDLREALDDARRLLIA